MDGDDREQVHQEGQEDGPLDLWWGRVGDRLYGTVGAALIFLLFYAIALWVGWLVLWIDWVFKPEDHWIVLVGHSVEKMLVAADVLYLALYLIDEAVQRVRNMWTGWSA